MPDAKQILLLLLGVVAGLFCLFWGWELTQRKQWGAPTIYQTLVGVVTEFFDALGIGSFATTTALYRPRRTVADELIPGTLNVGHLLPTVVQAFIFITIVKVEIVTLVALIAASVVGAYLGAGVVTRLPRVGVRVGMGIGLLAAAACFVVRLLTDVGQSGEVLGLQDTQLGIAIVGCLVIGALMTIGIGAYAPIMIMVSLLGMKETTAFPIMAGACAFLMPVASVRFVLSGRYDARAALGLTLGGIPAVLVAALLVKSLPLYVVKWLVVVVVVYTAVSMLFAAFRERRSAAALPASQAPVGDGHITTASADIQRR